MEEFAWVLVSLGLAALTTPYFANRKLVRNKRKSDITRDSHVSLADFVLCSSRVKFLLSVVLPSPVFVFEI